MAKVQIALSLPPGIWQTIWFGSLQRSPVSAISFGIHTFFRLMSSNTARPVGSIEHVLISLDHMHLLPLGRLVNGEDGELLHIEQIAANHSKRSVLIDLSRENTTVVTRSAIPQSGPAADWCRTIEYDGLLIRAKRTVNTPEVLIPCASLFQFYWGVSSTLSDAVLSGKLEDLERYVYVPEHTQLDKNGHFRLEVRRQWEDQIAPYLATILADPEATASGRDIFRQLVASAQSRRPNEPLQFEVLPPFPRILQIEGHFHAATADNDLNNSPLFLTHISSADLSPNWKILSFRRENDNRRTDDGEIMGVGDEEQYPPSETISLPGSSISTNDVEIEELPSGYSLNGATLPLLATLDDRFPSLKKHPAFKAPKEHTAQRDSRVRVMSRDGPWSAIRGSPGGNRDVLQAKLVGGRNAAPYSPSLDKVESKVELIGAQLDEFAESFIFEKCDFSLAGKLHSVKATFLDPYLGINGNSHPLFFSLPKTVNEDRITWLYSDPHCLITKRGVCIELNCIDSAGCASVRYLIDFESRQPKRRPGSVLKEPLRNGYIVVWFKEPNIGTSLYKDICRVIEAVAINRNPSISSRPSTGIFTRSLRHGELTMRRRLIRIFNATDQSDPQRGSEEKPSTPSKKNS